MLPSLSLLPRAAKLLFNNGRLVSYLRRTLAAGERANYRYVSIDRFVVRLQRRFLTRSIPMSLISLSTRDPRANHRRTVLSICALPRFRQSCKISSECTTTRLVSIFYRNFQICHYNSRRLPLSLSLSLFLYQSKKAVYSVVKIRSVLSSQILISDAINSTVK